MDKHKSLQQIIDFRLEKLESIRANGYDPYPYGFNKTFAIKELINNSEDSIDTEVSIAGRIVSIRKMGKASFIHIQDSSGKIQCYVRKDSLEESLYDNLFKKLDLGDIVGIVGKMFVTKMGELSVKTSALTILSKNIRPLPNLKEKDGEAFNSFDDKELRYRHRYLDFIANPETKQIFIDRAKIISSIRLYLDDKGFIEVETPVLQPIYGGASARPFKTHHNTLNQDLYLRIADELYLKKLIVGGFEKVYELAKNFRNEGMDRSHNPEYTSLEFYEAYKDVNDMMDLTEELIKNIASTLKIKTLHYLEHKINFNSKFAQRSIFSLLEEKLGEKIDDYEKHDLFKLAKSKNIKVESNMNYGQLLDAIFSEVVEPFLIQPTFVTDYPKEISPLAKEKRNSDGNLVERFELFICGMEFANAFSELNDPIEQRKRLESQAKLRDLGDEEAQVVDESFLQAIETGMPPTGGVGIGIDRLIMLFTGQSSIKDVLLFPAMRPENM
jgi:lysyl-tRNA synthetase class 2